MKFIAVTALVASVFFNQGMGAAVDAGGEIQALAARQSHPVAFNVAVAGKACGTGTTITCSLAPGQSCKGNFSPAQASIEIVTALSGCHVSLYPQDDQQGGVTERLDTGTAGICVFTSTATWKSYGIFC